MKISLMIKSTTVHTTTYRSLLVRLQWMLAITLLSIPLGAASPPKQLSTVIDQFMGMEATSVKIKQVIDWRFSSKSDTVRIQIDINGGRNFHVLLAAFGMEIFVSENEMITLNHSRQQVLYENATPDALLKQLFVGGDLNDARFKGEKKLKDNRRRLNFQFDSDFSDWESLAVVLSDDDKLQKLVLVDYDGNKYIISLEYLLRFNNFTIPNIDQDYLHYQVADLRGN